MLQDVGMLEAAKNAIREENGVYMMVHHLGHENPKLLTILTDCLRILAIKNAATKELILQGNGPTLLVNIMKHQTYKNLIFMTSRLLKGKIVISTWVYLKYVNFFILSFLYGTSNTITSVCFEKGLSKKKVLTRQFWLQLKLPSEALWKQFWVFWGKNKVDATFRFATC